MKKLGLFLLSALLALFFMGCTKVEVGTPDTEGLLVSYYTETDQPSYAMLQKDIFKDLLNQWTDDSIVNPVWNYESFTPYYVLSDDLTPTDDRTLYHCTFTADGEKYGYVILQYQEGSLMQVSLAETPYLYDLRPSIHEITLGLKDLTLDMETAQAARIRLNNPTGPVELIRITDDEGHLYMCHFGDASIDVLPHPALK